MAGANSPVAPIAGSGDGLTQLINLIGGVTGTKNSSTSKTNVSAEGINRLIQSALQGQSGLAGVFAAPAVSGGYNSSTKSLLANDLLSRIAAEAQAKTVGTTTTENKGGVGMSGLVKGLALREGVKAGSSALKSLVAGGSAVGAKELTGFMTDSFGSAAQSQFGGLTGASDWLGSASGDALGLSGSITGMEGLGQTAAAGTSVVNGMLSDAFVPGTSAVLNLLDGEWGKDDLGSVIGTTVGSFFGGPAGGAVGNFVGSALGEPVLQPIEQNVGNIFGSVTGAVEDLWGSTIGKVTSGCFITTAVCEATGKPDDCEELTVLREFRDSYVTSQYPELLEQYYREAPGLVEALKQQASLNKQWYWNHLYVRYIKPAVEFIKAGDNHSALAVYRDLFDEVEAQAGA